jgi:ubiquinone/menaquinone biosynthesis C-methylase UbiE
MQTRTEVDRIQGVYREYAVRGLGESKWSVANPGNQALQRECDGKLQQLLRQFGYFPLRDRRILDVGCGAGERLATMEEWGAGAKNLFGVDLMPERIEAARSHHPGINFELANAEELPFADRTFHLAAVFTVFTSILDQRMAANISRELDRVLVSGGALIWYDFRIHNPLNRHVRGISRKGIARLFPGYEMNVRSISLLPLLARRLGGLTRLLYPALSSLPFLRSHYLGLLVKPPANRGSEFHPL